MDYAQELLKGIREVKLDFIEHVGHEPGQILVNPADYKVIAHHYGFGGDDLDRDATLYGIPIDSDWRVEEGSVQVLRVIEPPKLEDISVPTMAPIPSVPPLTGLGLIEPATYRKPPLLVRFYNALRALAGR